MFTFYTDPGHGWLEVPFGELKALGLNPQDFSRYSYSKRNVFYLEEDCDAPKFVEAWKAKHGSDPQFREEYQSKTFIRNLPPIW
jgi:hypothetical protein